MRALPQRVHEQIQSAIAVNIRKDRASRMPPAAANPGAGGHVFKFPIAEIAIESIGAIDGA